MLRQKLILGYTAQICGQFFSIVAGIVVARVAGPTVLGTVAFGLAYVSMWFFLADLGFGTAHIKLISEGYPQEKCNGTYLRIRLLTTLFFVLFVIGVFAFQKFVLKVQFESRTHEYVIGIFLLTQIVTSLSMIPQSTFIGFTQQAKKDIPLLLDSMLNGGFKIAVVLLGGKALGISLATLVPAVLTLAIYLVLFKDYEIGKYDSKLAKKYLTMSLPIFVMALSTNMVQYIDRVMLGFFTDSEQVGFYTAGFRIGGLVQMVGTSVGMLFFPVFSAAFASRNLHLIRDRIDSFERFSFIFIMPLVILVAVFAPLIVRVLLGPVYAPATAPMILVNLAMFLYILSIPYGNTLTGKGLFTTTAAATLISLILFVVLQIFFLSGRFLNWQATGTAMALVAINVFMYAAYQFLAKRKTGVAFVNNHVFMIVGIVELAGLLLFHRWISQYVPATVEVLMSLVYILQFYLCLYFFGLIRASDWHMLQSVFRVRQLKNYVWGEVFGRA